jgi:hypothetical protein
MECHLLVPDLFWPAAAGAEPYRKLTMPALETLFARGRRERIAGISLERWLAKAFAAHGQLPLAAYALRGDGGEPGAHCWMHADPVHLKVHGDRLILADASRLALTAEEARDLVSRLNAQFAPEGIEFVAPVPQRWYARVAAEPRLTTTPTAEVAGRNVDAFLPAGDDGARWRQIFNEAQMLLHAHPGNEAREARGALTVNSLWFWGAGKAGSPYSPFDAVWSNHPLAAGLALSSHVGYHPLPASAAGVLEEADGDSLLIVADLLPSTAYGDLAAWRHALTTLEQDWFAPLLAAVKRGAVETLTLRGLGADYGYTVEIERGDLWRFWRTAKSLTHYAA